MAAAGCSSSHPINLGDHKDDHEDKRQRTAQSPFEARKDARRLLLDQEVPFEHACRHVDMITGGYKQQEDAVLNMIKTLTTNGENPFWVGIAGNGVNGVKQRWDSKYKPAAFQRIALVYKTESNKFHAALEKRLVKSLVDLGCSGLQNKVGGGGGKVGAKGPWHVYVAWDDDGSGAAAPPVDDSDDGRDTVGDSGDKEDEEDEEMDKDKAAHQLAEFSGVEFELAREVVEGSCRGGPCMRCHQEAALDFLLNMQSRKP
jgi:hypothetical protein